MAKQYRIFVASPGDVKPERKFSVRLPPWANSYEMLDEEENKKKKPLIIKEGEVDPADDFEPPDYSNMDEEEFNFVTANMSAAEKEAIRAQEKPRYVYIENEQ